MLPTSKTSIVCSSRMSGPSTDCAKQRPRIATKAHWGSRVPMFCDLKSVCWARRSATHHVRGCALERRPCLDANETDTEMQHSWNLPALALLSGGRCSAIIVANKHVLRCIVLSELTIEIRTTFAGCLFIQAAHLRIAQPFAPFAMMAGRGFCNIGGHGSAIGALGITGDESTEEPAPLELATVDQAFVSRTALV